MTETNERNATPSTVKSDIVTVSHSPRLLDRVRERICVLHYSRSTEKTYIHWILGFIRFHGRRHPQDLRDALDLAYYIGQRPADILRLSETDVREGLIEFRQGKTRRPMRIAVTGGLAALLDRIAARKAQYPVRALALLVDERGRPMTKAKLRARFEAARAAAGIQGEDFQFRDMRRKAGTDLRDQAGRDAAQALLGHETGEMTEHYTGGRGKICSAIPSERPGKSRAS